MAPKSGRGGAGANVFAGMLSFFAAGCLVQCVSGTSYTVGDSVGWGLNNDYATWAKQHDFAAGDTVVFVYGPSHSVLQVSQADYQACNINNYIKAYSSGKDTVTLRDTSSYFICGTPGHCQSGMKLAITATSTTPTTPSTPSAGGGTTPSSRTPPSPVASGSSSTVANARFLMIMLSETALVNYLFLVLIYFTFPLML